MPAEGSLSRDSPAKNNEFVLKDGQSTTSWDISDRVSHGVGSATTPSPGRAEDEPAGESASCSSSTSSSTVETIHLRGKDDDPLIPSETAIRETYYTARHTWQTLVSSAASLPPWTMPRGTCMPSIMLKDVPPIPTHKAKSRGGIEGVPVWCRRTGEDEEPTLVHGLDKWVRLLCPRPTTCHFRLETCPAPDTAPRALGILTLCWSYIISKSLLELQGRAARYSEQCLRPTVASAYVPNRSEYVINIRSPASEDLVRWLCLILARDPWGPTKAFPVWTMLASGDVDFVILTDIDISFDFAKETPTASEALELLLELCWVFGLDESPCIHARILDKGAELSEEPPPTTLAFLAALALPTYAAQELKPVLTLFPLETFAEQKRRGRPGEGSGRIRQEYAARIRQYLEDLPYYMTLSADTCGLQSIFWSVFWQQDITCKLVSPWLAGILNVLRPLIQAKDVSTISQTFALRRPRVAPWWTGLLLLGNDDIWEQMTLWLETTEGRYGRGLAAFCYPDITVSAWTGSPNSFLELENGSVAASYPDPEDLVPRIDVLRCRFNYNLRDKNSYLTTCWRPDGLICKAAVELEIWPSLEQGFAREYSHWKWKDFEDQWLGFRRETGRFVEMREDLGISHAGGEDSDPGAEAIPKQPTIRAVGQMVGSFMRDVFGSTAEATAALPGFETHEWQKEWNILPSCW